MSFSAKRNKLAKDKLVKAKKEAMRSQLKDST
jgi:hypothetical protein